MKSIDIVDIIVISGNGGSTTVNIRKNWKVHSGFYINYGGNGGDVWIIGDKNYNTLSHLFFKRVFSAEHGQCGYGRGCRGRSGKSLFVHVPLGTRVLDSDEHCIIGDLVSDQQKLMLVKGGVRGFLDTKSSCNKHGSFKVNTFDSKKKIIFGCDGHKRNIKLELLLLADVGILGLPNSGKSTFVRCISSARPKVGDYPFTTLEPCLGVVYIKNRSFTVADIPGLIQGASKGLGLGFSFLRHLQRCRMLLHFIDISIIDHNKILENIRIIFHELKFYNKDLVYKPIWLIFNKVDLIDINKIRRKVNNIILSLRWNGGYYLISSKFSYGIHELCCDIMRFIKNNNK